MRSVSYRIAVGAASVSADRRSPLVSLRTAATLEVPVNACRLVLHGGAGADAKPGDPVTVDLGHGTSLARVFTGSVSAVARGIAEVRVEAAGAFAALAAARLNLLYERETAGGVVKDVLGRLNVPAGTVQPGLRFPALALDDGRSAWAHLRGVARRSGYDFFEDVQGRANFRARAPGAAHAFRYGAEVLAFEEEAVPAPWEGVEVFGESPAGQGQGEDAASWVTRKEVKGSAGGGGRVLRLADPAARTPELAGQVAAGVLASAKRSAEGTLRVLGAPAVGLGDTVTVNGLPGGGGSPLRVTGVRHRVDARAGFVTDLRWERA